MFKHRIKILKINLIGLYFSHITKRRKKNTVKCKGVFKKSGAKKQ